MEFRLVAHWNRVLRERNRLDYSHFSNKLCLDLGWLAAKFTDKKEGAVFNAPSPVLTRFRDRLPGFSTDIPDRNNSPVAVAADNMPARSNTGKDAAYDNSRCAVAARVDSPPASLDETPVARARWKSSRAVRS
jgi:hypothetical protein